jgi:2'-5' RNA ligase
METTHGYAVELYFDTSCEARLRAAWAAAGSSLPALNATPHVSLAVLPEIDDVNLPVALRRFAASEAPLQLQFAAVGAFPTAEGVVFLAPVVTGRLLALHQRCHALLAGLGEQPNGYYLPDRWVPHCTVGQDLPPDQVSAMVATLLRAAVFEPCRVVALGLVRFRPFVTIGRFPLGASSTLDPGVSKTPEL